MKKRVFLSFIVLLFLISCAPQTEVNDESAPEEPVIELVPENDPQSTPENMNPIVPEETPEFSQDDLFEEPNTQKPEPTVIDRSDLATPDPDSGSESVVQPAPGIPDGMAKLLNEVQLHLSEKLGVEVEEIETIAVEEVQWRDSSIGCPVAGMSYLQVITSGFRILLAVDGQTYHYHSRDTSNFVLCENPQSPAPGGAPPSFGDT